MIVRKIIKENILARDKGENSVHILCYERFIDHGAGSADQGGFRALLVTRARKNDEARRRADGPERGRIYKKTGFVKHNRNIILA
jgi:hypothetical protein